MRWFSASVLWLALVGVGCSSGTGTQQTTTSATHHHEEGEDDHEHSREKMMAAHAGKLHAWLAAHLSEKEGNELDILFETMGKDPKPVPIPVAQFTGRAKRAGEEKEYDLVFEPAPASERKGDPPGACSHFVAKAPWMKPDDVLTVTAQVEIDGKMRRPRWAKFTVKDHAHHHGD